MWLKKNWQNVIAFVFIAMFIFSPDAKAWFIRQVASTGLFNSKIEEKATEIKAYVVSESEMKEFTLKMGELTDDEREIILKGCLINYNRK